MLKRITRTPLSLASLLSPSLPVKNVLWNLLGGGWAGVLIVLATPWYVSRLGFEGYGVVGLWAMMQVLMGLLDMGMGATVIKEFADSRRSGNPQEFKRDLLKTLEIVYWVIAGLFTLSLLLAASWVGNFWLQAQTLPRAYIGNAIRLMAITLGFQFPCVLYSNGLAGLQEHGRMNILQILGHSFRYGLGAAALFWRADLVWFFAVQAMVSALQTFVTRRMLWGMIAGVSSRQGAFQIAVFQRLWRFSVGMALTSFSAVLLANADRIALSKMLPTAELGKYAVAFTATGLLQLGIAPFYRAFFPRYSELTSLGDIKQLRNEYFRSCRLMAAVIIPLGIIGWLFAPQIFYAWLGKDDKTIIDVFRWLLVGITCSGLMWLPAAFQQAQGRPGLHAAMIAGALLLGTPAMIWAIKVYGTVGATMVWVLHGVSGITIELWFMHRRLLIGELMCWYRSVILSPLLLTIPLAGLSWWLMPNGLNKLFGLCWIGATGMVVIAVVFFINSSGDHKDIQAASAGICGE